MSDDADREASKRSKLQKSARYLEVAEVAFSADIYDPCVSCAVSAGINAADALCIHMFGSYVRGKSHDEVLAALRKGGLLGSQMANQLGPLLKLKNKAQYEVRSCTSQEAGSALARADRIYKAVEHAFRLSSK